MRDGKKIAVDILKVTDGKKYPVILELTPYGRCFFLIFFQKKFNLFISFPKCQCAVGFFFMTEILIRVSIKGKK